MKFLCSQAELNKSLQLVSRAVVARSTNTMLSSILLNADSVTGQLSITSFNLSLGIKTSLSASIEASGSVTLPYRLFGEIISRLSNETPISICCLKDTDQIEITSYSGTYQVRSMPADDFPKLPSVDNGTSIRLEAEALIRGLRGTLFASSNDEAKQVLTGVHLRFNGQELECAATDGHRLAILRFTNAILNNFSDKNELRPEDFAVTLPTRSLKELEKVLSSYSSKEDINLFYDHGQAVFLWPDQVLTCRTLDGIYPSYQNLIPETFSQSIVLDRRMLITALERVAVLAGQQNNIVTLACESSSNQLHISADAPDVGSASETMTVSVNGGPIQIAFNVRYLLDGVKAISDEMIEISCNASDTPAILTSQAELYSFTYLIMPVQIRD
uniref:DNA polymerase III subunit beta n=1 Tax=Paulinella longichromatophora TaxID=1708747 RepID=A0A2H4ZPC5_9EUKA|nr:DNA polymerase III subunit beta [Paulinella longichromatophora]